MMEHYIRNNVFVSPARDLPLRSLIRLPRSTNRFTIPAPIPCEAPVTMAVFRGPLMVVYLYAILLL